MSIDKYLVWALTEYATTMKYIELKPHTRVVEKQREMQEFKDALKALKNLHPEVFARIEAFAKENRYFGLPQ